MLAMHRAASVIAAMSREAELVPHRLVVLGLSKFVSARAWWPWTWEVRYYVGCGMDTAPMWDPCHDNERQRCCVLLQAMLLLSQIEPRQRERACGTHKPVARLQRRHSSYITPHAEALPVPTAPPAAAAEAAARWPR